MCTWLQQSEHFHFSSIVVLWWFTCQVSGKSATFKLHHYVKKISYLCAHIHPPSLKHLNVAVTHLSHCHIKTIDLSVKSIIFKFLYMCTQPASTIPHLHVAVILPTRLLHKNGLSDNSTTFILRHCVKLFPYICAHSRLPLLKHLRGVVTHLPDCHIKKMGLPFEWQDNYSEITPLPKTRLNPHLRMSVHLFRFQGTHEHFILLTTRRK